MTTFDKKNKRRATIFTIVLHAILVILFFIYGLTEPRPLPQDAGATVEFGWDQQAGGQAVVKQPAQKQPKPQKTQPQQQPEQEEVEETATEENTDIAVPEDEPEKENKTEEVEDNPEPEETTDKEEPEEKQKPKPTVSDKLDNALKGAWKSHGKGEGQGDSQGDGNKGNPEGSDGKGALGGGSGSWQLSGRSMIPGYGTQIKDTEEEGIIVLNIWVDRNGNVTRVTPNIGESNTTSQYLFNLAKSDVRSNFKFNPDPSAKVEQRGKVRFKFELE